MTKNERRKQRARFALRAYIGFPGKPTNRITSAEEIELAVTDLLTDLMHLVRPDKRIPTTFGDLVQRAEGHYAEERRHQW